MKPSVIIGFIGNQLDSGEGQKRWERWRPTVALGMQEGFVADRIELLVDLRRSRKLADLMVADVSAVGLDWLYLRPERPLLITDRHADAERLRADVPVSRCADVVDAGSVGALTELVGSRLDEDEHRLGRAAMRRHYFDDLHVGDSLPAFVDSVTGLVGLRDRLLAVDPDAGERSVG